ncbi:caspase family protein [Mameliella alba]|uniref:OmpA/MotB n=1 Tax=Mameliella alba TaxID=561184 RepID=A0A0B3SE41_9RHOB|nr:caspase family protein [Mameliella alba]KHQ54966.1 OmpA/MotB [Mameliella alba]
MSRFSLTVLAATLALFLPALSAQAAAYGLRSDLSCEARVEVTNRLAGGTRVSLSGNSLDVGERLSIDWARPGFPEREPIFLMVSFDRPVRLSGDGMYALLPGAKAPFDISWNRDRTRAIISYYGRGMAKSGRIAVEPLQSGPLQVDWAVLGHSGCDEHVETPGQGNATVTITTAGRPVIVVRDRVTGAAPSSTLVNRDGTRHLQVFDGRFRLTDAATGAEIMEKVGAPHFSPAGRYVVLPGGDEAGIYDAVDGKRVVDAQDGFQVNSDWSALIWSHDDSFALQILSGYGFSQFHNFAAGRTVQATTNGCRICGGNKNSYLLELENNAFVAEGYNEMAVFRLSDGDETYRFRPELGDGARVQPSHRNAALQEIGRQQAVVEPAIGIGLRYSTEVAIAQAFPTHFSQSYQSKENQIISEALAPYLVTPRKLEAVAGGGIAPRSLSSSALAWRSLGADAPGAADRMFKRLREFGLPVVAGEVVERIDVEERLPSYDARKQYATPAERLAAQDLHDLRVTDAFRKFWTEIAAATGVDVTRFGRRMSLTSCSAANDKLLGDFHTLWRWSSGGAEHRLTTFQCHEGSAAFAYPTTYLFSSNLSGGISQFEQPWGIEPGLDLRNDGTNTATICPYAIDACSFRLIVFGDLAILHSQEALGYAVVDLRSGKVIAKQFDLPRGDLFDNVMITEDGRHLVTVQEDGSFFVNRLSDSETVLSGLYADDEVVVWTENGHYDATSEGAYFVAYTFPGHLGEYTAQQFEGFLKVPGLAQQVLAGLPAPDPVRITPPPVLQASVTVSGTKARLDAQAQASVPIKTLSLFQDGLRTHVLQGDGQDNHWQDDFELFPGTRWVTLVATDENDVASVPFSVEITMPEAQRQLHILSIGVNDYGDPALDLTAAVPDARLVASALAGRAGSTVGIASETVLLDGEATPDRILSELSSIIAKARPGDTLALYFAGHGLDLDGGYYLGASGTSLDDIAGTALSFSSVSALLEGTDIRIALFIDACHSGRAGEGLFSTNDQVVGGALDQIPSGLVVFAAAKGREFSLEDPETEQGFFAQALAEVIQDGAFDRNENGLTELSELFEGTKRLVSSRVRDAQEGVPPIDRLSQTPWMARNLMVGDFVLF